MIGEKIRSLRESRGISQVELSHRVNVTKQAVSNWENDNIMPSLDAIIQLAEYFNVTTDYLLDVNHHTDEHFVIPTEGLTLEQFSIVCLIVKEYSRGNRLLANSFSKFNASEEAE